MTSTFKMIDIGFKPITHRVAFALGEILLSEKVRRAIEEKSVPKGDVLTLAEIAGITAAKKTSEILPLCHPLNLDSVSVQCEVDSEKNSVIVLCAVTTHARTGVEMEALSGVSAALLCIYDLTKGLDKGATITGIRLEHKEGGKSGSWWHPLSKKTPVSEKKVLESNSAAVITVSDSGAKGERVDESGNIIISYLKDNGTELIGYRVVPDEVELIRGVVKEFGEADLILITGGTGIGPRDCTPEALAPLWTKHLPGFGETFRSQSLVTMPRAWLSRAEAGLVGKTLVVLLPGSPGGVRDGLAVLDKILPHMISMIRGGGN